MALRRDPGVGGALRVDFFDDDEGNMHEAPINHLAASGITGGCDIRQYCPGDYVRRDQMAAYLYRGPLSPLGH